MLYTPIETCIKKTGHEFVKKNDGVIDEQIITNYLLLITL